MTEFLRAEWYDIDAGDEAGFLEGLHTGHLPKLQDIPGISWIAHYRIAPKPAPGPQRTGVPERRETTDPSVQSGSEFVLLTSVTDPDLAMLSSSGITDLELKSSSLLALRKNYREAVFVEEQCIEGPASNSCPRCQPPPTMQLGNFNVSSPADECELGNYYRMHRFPQVAATAGCIRARKLVSTIGWPKHGILYEFQSMNEGDALFETRFNNAIENKRWEGRHILSYVLHAPNAPHAGRRIWPET
jgi:hypothetical protein